jgi:hypothetical protein
MTADRYVRKDKIGVVSSSHNDLGLLKGKDLLGLAGNPNHKMRH